MIKTLNVRDVFDFLAKFAPPSLAEEWDNIGLQVGSMKARVRGILVSLDVTEEALWEAVENKLNLIVTHHPLFFRPIHALDDSTSPSRLVTLAAQMGIHILSFHTNLDSTPEGLNDLLGKKLGIKNLKPLTPSRDLKIKRAGLGRIGTIRKSNLKSLVEAVAKQLKLKNLRFIGDLKHPVAKVAVMTGSGGGFFREAKRAGADALITGDVKYHDALDAMAEGIALIDIGHYAGEIGMVGLVANQLKAWTKKKQVKIKILETKVSEDPFLFWNKK